MNDFMKERNEAFLSKDKKRIETYCKKYNVAIPEDEEIFWAGVHKAICNLFVVPENNISIKDFNESYEWLQQHGYSTSMF